MSWDDALDLEVPVRKWLINRWNKQKEVENGNGQPPTDRPLTESERRKMIAEGLNNSPNPQRKLPSEFMNPVRNNK